MKLLLIVAMFGAAAALKTAKDPVHIANILNGNYHIAYVPEQDLIVSKAGLGPGATGVDMPCAAPCGGAVPVPTPKADVYKDHGGSKCDNLLALEFETTPTGSVGAKADAVLGAAKGANSLHFGTKGWTNITSCDMDDGCTSKMEENSRSFTQEAPAQTRLIRFALNYGEEDGGDACDKRQDQKEKEYLESVKKEEDYKVKKAEEEEKNRMSKCDKGEEYSRTEKDCIKCVDSKYNDEKGGKPCKERITKCPKGQYLDTKDKSLEEDDKCVACEAKEYSDKEDGAKDCTEWKDKCPKGQGWAAGSSTEDAACKACDKGKYSASDDDISECADHSGSDPGDCKAGEMLQVGTAEKDSKCVAVPDGTFRCQDCAEPKKWKDSCPAGEELTDESAVKDRECEKCKPTFFKAKEGKGECIKLQVCNGKGEINAEGEKGKGSVTTQRICECKEGWKEKAAAKAGEIDCEPKNPCSNGSNNCHEMNKKSKCNYKGPGKFDCTCLPGFFSKTATTTDPCKDWKTTCPAGTELDGGDSKDDKTCDTCVAGKYKSKDDGSQCVDWLKTCAKGQELLGGSTKANKECKDCSATTWKAGQGADKCGRRTVSCKAGEENYKGANGFTDNDCKICPAGKYKSSPGTSKCKDHKKTCPPGAVLTSGTKVADSTCTPCTGPKFKAGTNGDKKCTPWTPGCPDAGTYYKPGSASTDRTCPKCPSTHYNTLASAKGGKACTPFTPHCAPGRYMVAAKGPTDQTANRECKACTKGKYRAGNGVLGKSCLDQPTDPKQCPVINPAKPFYKLSCSNPGGKDPSCLTVKLTCKPDEEMNTISKAKDKCKSTCGVNGKSRFEEAAWVADLKAGKKLDPVKDIFSTSANIKSTAENPHAHFCMCDCTGQGTQDVGGNQANEYFFDVFKNGGPGCVKVVGGQLTCYSVGDPHPRTYSHTSYNYYQYGEYVFSYRQDFNVETRIFAGQLHPKIAGGIAAAFRDRSSDPAVVHDEICRIKYGLIACSGGLGDDHFVNDAAYKAFDQDPNKWKSNSEVTNQYKNAPAKCRGTNYWSRNKAGNNPKGHDAIKISRWSNGAQFKGSDGTLMQINFWRSGCYKGRGHGASRRGGNEASSYCGGRYYINAYMRLTRPDKNSEVTSSRMYGLCGTPQTDRNRDNINIGLNTGTQSGRHDGPRDIMFKKIKLPGAGSFARQTTGAKLDYRSYFWCSGRDNDFANTDYEQAEHPKNGQRFWSLLDEAETTSKNGKNKFRNLRASLLQVGAAPEEPKKDDDEEDDAKVAARGGGAEKGAKAPDDTENEVKDADAQKACKDRGIKVGTTAYKNCVSDVSAAGAEAETKEDMLRAGKDEEKADDDVEEATGAEAEVVGREEKTKEKNAAKDGSDPKAPIVEACVMGAGVDCSKDSAFVKVVSLPSKVFDKKEWNTIKVVLPVKKGEKVTVRFRQKQTSCECCDDWGIDSLQFLAGDQCYPASINEDSWVARR